MKIFLLCLLTTLLAMPKEVVFMRHGHKSKVPKPTDGRENNWQKTLTEHGFEDARGIQQFLTKYREEHSDDEIVLYASPFRRAIMTVACFAHSTQTKIRLDRSLGENSFPPFGMKEWDHGVWDPKIKKEGWSTETNPGCDNPGNVCSFSNTDCGGIFDVRGTRGPNCDLEIRRVVKHCDPDFNSEKCEKYCNPDPKSEKCEKYCNLDIIDPSYKQKTVASKRWFGKKSSWFDSWKNDHRLRAEYVIENIIKLKENDGKRVIIASHGDFMRHFFWKYVDGGRRGKFNTGTMAFLQPNLKRPTGSSKYLKAVGERFSFTDTNDMLWTNTLSQGCVNDATPSGFGYQRSPWVWWADLHTPVSIPMVARKNGKVSGLVIELERKNEDCKGLRLEYMDCEKRTTWNSKLPTCLLAGWKADGGFKCMFRSLLMNNEDSYSAQAQQKYKESSWILNRYSTDNPGFWAKMDGLEKLQGGCQLRPAAKESKHEVSEFSFESKEPQQISWRGEWPEESLYISDDDDDSPYIGCFVDDESRDLSVEMGRGQWTIDTCGEACQGYAYFAYQDGANSNGPVCFCGNDYATQVQYVKVEDSECEVNGEMRGGTFRNAIYDNPAQERELPVLMSTRGGNPAGGNPFEFEAKSEFKVDGEMSMDFIFSPNPNILIKIASPVIDINADMQFSLQKGIEHDINLNQYELTKKKTLYSDFFLVGAVPITMKVLAQPVADIHIKGTSEVSGLVSMKLDGKVRISDDFIQLRLDLLEGEIDYNTIEPSLQLTGFNDIWSFDYHAMANLDIDVKVGIQIEIVVADAISFEVKPSVHASTTLSSGTPNNGETSSCPLTFSASAQLGTSMDIGAGLKHQDGNDFNLITLMEENCKTFEDQLTDGWFDWIDDWHSSLMDFSSDYYYDQEGSDQEGSYSAVCSAVFDVLDMSIGWDGSINALKDLHFDQNMYDTELSRFDSPQVCMGPEGFEVNSRGYFSGGIPKPRPSTRPTTNPTPKPTPSPTPTPSGPTSTPRPTPKPTPSPKDGNVFCKANSDCASDEYCDYALAFTCQKKRAAFLPCVPGRGDCKDGLTCTPLFLCIPTW